MADEGDAERLVVMLEARIRDFEKNMAKAEGTATKSYGQMRRGSQSATPQMEADIVRSSNRINTALASTSTRIGAFSKTMIAGFVAPIAGLLTLRAAIGGTKAALEQFDEIADKSAAGGVDPEFFQALAYQAKLSGVEIGGVASALETFAKNSGLAAEGKGRMVSTLQTLNPELLASIQAATTQEQRFKLVADALRDAKDEAQAAAIAAAAFGDQGPKIVAAFRGGSAEIERMAIKAKEMGLIVDRELIERADELGDEFDTASQIVDLKLKQAFISLAPYLVTAAGWAAEFARLMGVAADQLKTIEDRKFLNPLQNELIGIQNRMIPLNDSIAELRAQLEKQDPSSGWAGQLAGDIRQKTEQYDALMDQALRLQERIAQLQGKPANDPATGLPAVTPPGTGGGGDKPADPTKAQIKAAKSYDDLIAAAQRRIDQLGVEMAALGMTDAAAASLRNTHELLTAAEATGMPMTDSRIQQLLALSDAMTDAQMAQERLNIDIANTDPWTALGREIERLDALLLNSKGTWEGYGAAVFKANANALSSTLGALGQVTSALAGAFQENKALAAANVVVSTGEGIMKALGTQGPFGWLQAAAIGAAGAAQLASVMSARPGSASLAGAAPSAPSAPAVSSSQQGPQSIYLTLGGSGRYSREEVAGLMKQMIEMQGDGYQLVLKE